MYYSYRDLPESLKDKELWAFDYATNNTEKGMGLKAKPYKCVIKNLGYRTNTYPIRDGKISESKAVRSESRHYAETYEDAVKGYNELVDKQIDFLIMMAKKHSDDKIVEE